MSELFIELYSEEIPSNFIKSVVDVFKSTMLDYFISLNLIDENEQDFCEIYTTPCRIIFYTNKLHDNVVVPCKEIIGPKIDADKEEINGFLNAHLLKSVNELSKSDKNYILKQKNLKINTKRTLEENMKAILTSISLNFAKNISWNNINTTKWISPLRNILCLYNNDILNFEFCELQSTNTTYGHKILIGLDKKINIENFSDYKNKMKQSYVIFDQNERKNIINEKVNDIKQKLNKEIFIIDEVDFKENLIDDIVNTTEYPDVFVGEFSNEFLQIPVGVISNIICGKYKAFCLFDSTKKILSNNFIFFVNTKTNDNGKFITFCFNNVINECLKFFDLELKKYLSENLETKINKLKSIPYYKDFGTVYNSVERIMALSQFICLWMPHCDLISTKEASKLSKIDLTSTLVRDNPNLMGYLSSYYAKQNKYSDIICKGIEEFYEPRNISDKIPDSDIGKVISIAGRIDVITTLFIVNEEPSSSRDPYGIRKNITAIIKIILDSKINLPINVLIHKSISLFKTAVYKKNMNKKMSVKQQILDIENKIVELFKKRFVSYIDDFDYRQDVIDAVLNTQQLKNTKKIIDLNVLYNKIISVNKYINDNEIKFLSIVNTYKRLNNILYGFKINQIKSIFQKIFHKPLKKDTQEGIIKAKIKEVTKEIKKETKNGNYEKCLDLLLEFNNILDKYFKDNVVRTDNKKETNKRLLMLNMIKRIFDNFLNFSEIKNN